MDSMFPLNASSAEDRITAATTSSILQSGSPRTARRFIGAKIPVSVNQGQTMLVLRKES